MGKRESEAGGLAPDRLGVVRLCRSNFMPRAFAVTLSPRTHMPTTGLAHGKGSKLSTSSSLSSSSKGQGQGSAAIAVESSSSSSSSSSSLSSSESSLPEGLEGLGSAACAIAQWFPRMPGQSSRDLARVAHAFKVVVQSLTERTLRRIAIACLTDRHRWGMRDDGTEFYVRDLDNKTPSEQRIPKLVSDKACQVKEYEFGIASPTEPWLEEKEEWETMPELKVQKSRTCQTRSCVAP